MGTGVCAKRRALGNAVRAEQKGIIMTKTLVAVAFSTALLTSGSLVAVAQEGLFTSERDCTADVRSLCADVKPGGGRVLACLQSHVGNLSVGCSTILSKAIWTAQQCSGDIHQFCPTATFGNVSECMRPHLGEVSGTCKSALAFMASPAADRY
jgi:Cysteine rich repeat